MRHETKRLAGTLALVLGLGCEGIAPIEQSADQCFDHGQCAIGFRCVGAESGSAGLCLRPRHPICGDGLLRPDLNPGDSGFEACDDGNLDNLDGCTNACELPRCGDGFIRRDLALGEAGFENCEDGNLIDADACTNACQTARCGDGVLRAGPLPEDPEFEACDDGNADASDDCTTQCQIARCGDGFLYRDEACDDGNDDDRDACTSDCMAARCGDGITRADLQAGEVGYEQCDDGDDNDLNTCSNDCIGAGCGDGIVQEGEFCDDGDRVDDNGCDNLCGVGVTQIAASFSTACALNAGGHVYCWGRNGSGELGLGDRLDRGRATRIPTLEGVAQLSGNRQGFCARRGDGQVLCWGGHWHVSGPPESDVLIPTALEGIDDAIDLGMGNGMACVVHRDGGVSCTDFDAPHTRINGLSQIVSLSVGSGFACALDLDSAVFCWGNNNTGQLGDGTQDSRPQAERVQNLEPVSAVFALSYGVCVRHRDNRTSCWGGESAVPVTTDGPHLRPVSIAGLRAIRSIDQQYQQYPLAVLDDDSTWTWDHNQRMPVRHPTYSAQRIKAHARGWEVLCYLNLDQDVHCSARHRAFGQAGVGIDPYFIEPITLEVGPEPFLDFDQGAISCGVHAGAVTCWGEDTSYTNLHRTAELRNSFPKTWRLAGIDDATQVSVGTAAHCALKASGSIACWGQGSLLGDGNTEHRLEEPALVAGINNASSVQIGSGHACALLSDGEVRCWGANYRGQLGDGTTEASLTPVRVIELGAATQIALHSSTSCALISSGVVRCWGYDGGGRNHRLGQEEPIEYSSRPLAVAGLSGARWMSLNSGGCATTDHGAQCWGDNSTRNNQSLFHLGSEPVALVATDWGTAARTIDGQIYSWGYNSKGMQAMPINERSGSYGTWHEPHVIEGFGQALQVRSSSSPGAATCILTSTGNIQCVGGVTRPSLYHLRDATRVVGLYGD